MGAESPLPPIQAGDQGGRALVSHPHHYAECHDTTTQEFKSLPGHLGPAAAPIMEVVVRTNFYISYETFHLIICMFFRHSPLH